MLMLRLLYAGCMKREQNKIFPGFSTFGFKNAIDIVSVWYFPPLSEEIHRCKHRPLLHLADLAINSLLMNKDPK